MEVLCAQTFGYNLGIKLIRGAYMSEERHLAQLHGYESPIHETVQDTHVCYNDNMTHIISNLRPHDGILVASHNVETVDLAK
jgi:proline dehydrogenase